MLVLTEGPMKADVIHALTGLTVLAVPGVNSLTQLETTLSDLRAEGVAEIKTAFDMDFATNYHVQNGYNNLLSLLGNMGFQFGTYLWDPRYKGLFSKEALKLGWSKNASPFFVRFFNRMRIKVVNTHGESCNDKYKNNFCRRYTYVNRNRPRQLRCKDHKPFLYFRAF